MRHLFALALFALPAIAADDPKPATRAEYDALLAPLTDKLKKAQADYADADKRVEGVRALDGARTLAGTYTDSRKRISDAAKKVAELKAADKPDEKVIAGYEKNIKEAEERMEKAMKLLADKHPNAPKELVKATDDRMAAEKAVAEVNEATKKLGPRPKK